MAGLQLRFSLSNLLGSLMLLLQGVVRQTFCLYLQSPIREFTVAKFPAACLRALDGVFKLASQLRKVSLRVRDSSG